MVVSPHAGQQRKLEELERLLRVKETLLLDMRADMQRLADILQTNVTRAIYETFVDGQTNV